MTCVFACAVDDGIAVGISVTGLIAALLHCAAKHHTALASLGYGSNIVSSGFLCLSEGTADVFSIGDGTADNGILQHLGSIDMIHNRDSILADNR